MPGSVVIVTVSYYSGRHLTRFLESVRAQSSATVLIADNAPDDDLTGVAAPGIEVLRMPGNLGYGGAMNAAIAASPEAAASDWVLIANPDLEFSPGAIDRLLAAGAADDAVGAVGPLIRTPSGEVYPSARRLPSLRTGVGHALFARTWPGNPWTRAYLSDREHPPRRRATGWISGSCMLVRTSAFRAVGGFDEKFFMYFEDVDLCARLGAAGWTVLFEPHAEIMHVGGHATLQTAVNRPMIVAHHRSAYSYLAARYRGPLLAPLRLVLRVALAIRARVVH